MRRFLSLFILFFSFGCNSYTPKIQPEAISPMSVDYGVVHNKIIRPYCLGCHGAMAAGQVNLENYDNVVRNTSKIYDTVVVKGSMPPGQPLPLHLRKLVQVWVQKGSPQSSEGSIPQNPDPSPPKIQTTYESISREILIPKCGICHGQGDAFKDYTFFNSKGWTVPGDPEKSKLYQVLKQGLMPPGKKLKDEEVNAIGVWIADGAKNN